MIPVEYVPGEIVVYQVGSKSGAFPEGHLVSIILSTGEISCTCRGFAFHGRCHHVRSFRDLLGQGGIKVGTTEPAVPAAQ